MSVVVSTINYIHSRELTHRLFQDFLKAVDAEYWIPQKVRLLNQGTVLQYFVFFNLWKRIYKFLENKGKI